MRSLRSPAVSSPPTDPAAAPDVAPSGKAGRLVAAAAAGLSVPPMIVVAGGAAPPSPAELRQLADRMAHSSHRSGAAAASAAPTVAVRSAFSIEDRSDLSLAGWFRTELRVGLDDVTDAIERVRDSADDRDAATGSAQHGVQLDAMHHSVRGDAPQRVRRDVMVMAMVDAEHSGVVFSEPGTYDDLVNVTTGTAERLVSGEEAGESMLLARLEDEPEGWRRRLQQLLRDLRDHMGDEPLDVEWADDGHTCWLVQVRPITVPTHRNEAFTIANHAEILPPLPSQLMVSAIERAGDELFEWYRQHDRTLPSNRPFLEVLAGRPFINLTLLEDMLRHLGLPTRLVADSIGGPPDNDRPADLRRLVLKAPVLLRMGMAQVRAVVLARRNQQRLASIGDTPAPTFRAALDQLHDAYVGLVTGMFPLSSAIGPPLAVLRAAGTLTDHARRHRTVTTEFAEALDAVRCGREPMDAFMAHFGHRAVYESDIARPRFRDAPELLGHDPDAAGHPGDADRAGDDPGRHADASAAVGADEVPTHGRRRRSVRVIATWPVWAAARPPLAAREALRDRAMVGFAAIRDSLVALAHGAVADGQLRTVDDMWLLTVNEACALDDGWVPEAAFWSMRDAERAELAELDPPPVIHRFDDPATWAHDTPLGARLTGLPLTDGTVRGRAWVLREPSIELPNGFDPASTVLVARSVDAGWIPTFTRVAGVVVETGGDLSHGSILLRERGVPAITNVRGATRFVTTGDEVEVRVGAGVIERCS